MKKIILSSHGFTKNPGLKDQILNLLPQKPSNLSVAIITTASAEWKEKNKHAISAKETFENMGFKVVDFLDIEFESAEKLKQFDIIYINGGSPFYLLYHLKKSGADSIIKQLAEKGVIIVGISGGAVVLGPNINIVDFFDSQSNTIALKDLSGLNLTNIIIYPHYTDEMEEQIKLFESKFNVEAKRLSDDQSIVITDS